MDGSRNISLSRSWCDGDIWLWIDEGGGVGWRGRVGIMRTWYGKVFFAMVLRDTFSKRSFHFVNHKRRKR